MRYREVWAAYTFYYIPSITYPFPITTFTNTECHDLQSKITTNFLLALGFHRKTPHAVVFGPRPLAGISFRDLYTEQGTQRIQHFIGHLRKHDTAGKMHLANLLMLQLLSGTSKPLLEATHSNLNYMDKSLVMETRRFLRDIRCTIHIPAASTTPPPRDNDFYLMDYFIQQPYTKKQLQHLNSCHLFLQVLTLSDICDVHGSHILPEAMQGQPITTSKTTWIWPRQHRPPQASWGTWRTALKTHFIHNKQLTLEPQLWLGAWHINHKLHHCQWYFHTNLRTGYTWYRDLNGPIRLHHPHYYNMTRRTILTNSATSTPAAWQIACPQTIPSSIHTRYTLYHKLSIYYTVTQPIITPPPSITNLPLLPPDFPSWKRHLLLHQNSILNNPNQLAHSIASNTIVNIFQASTTNKPYNYFGWLICINHRIVWQGNGTVSTTINHSSKTRTQLHGLLAALAVITLHNKQANRILETTNVRSHILHPSLLQSINTDPTKSTLSSLRYNTPEYDVIAQIRHEITHNNIHIDISAPPPPEQFQPPAQRTSSLDVEFNAQATQRANAFHIQQHRTRQPPAHSLSQHAKPSCAPPNTYSLATYRKISSKPKKEPSSAATLKTSTIGTNMHGIQLIGTSINSFSPNLLSTNITVLPNSFTAGYQHSINYTITNNILQKSVLDATTPQRQTNTYYNADGPLTYFIAIKKSTS